MRRQSQAVAAALAVMLIGCGPRDNAGRDTGSGGDPAGSPSGMTSSPGMTDTSSVGGAAGTTGAGDTTGAAGTSGTTGMGTDTGKAGTAPGAGRSDSARGNQSESGVTNTRTGKSTTGAGATRTRPDQGQPVTSKGDTVGQTEDSGTTPPR
jgi:hypothetical protein